MTFSIKHLSLLVFLLILFASCSKDVNKKYYIIDGESVTIGTQEWMWKNLDVDRYRNGDTIPQVTDPKEWKKLTSGAWCYYDNDSAKGAIYGKLYNWYAVNDPRGLAPEGWHIASNEEWDILVSYLQNNKEYWCNDNSNYIAKSLATVESWNSSTFTCSIGNNPDANNSTGFSALPGGYRSPNGLYFELRKISFWWTSSEKNPSAAIHTNLVYNLRHIGNYYDYKEFGFSVRCVKNNPRYFR